MNGIISIFFALLFSGVAGSIFLVIWYLVRKVLDQWGHILLSYRFLKLILLIWVPPLIYLAIIRWLSDGDGSIRSALLSPSPRIEHILALGLPVWMLGVIAGSLYFLLWRFFFYWRHRDYVRGNSEIVSMLNDCKKKVQVHKRIIIRQCYTQEAPMTYGVFRPVILLPMDICSKSELEMVLIHELIHVKRKDFLVKRLAFVILLLQWMNPLAWWLFVMVEKWSEFSCDYETCEILGKPREYFQTILKMAMKESPKKGLLISLFENKHQVLERVKKMDSYHKTKRGGKIAVFILAAIAMLAGSITSLAASEGIVTGYDIIYQNMVTKQEEIIQPREYIEYVETEVNPQIRVEMGDISTIPPEGTALISWSVGNIVSRRTYPFSASEGRSIVVSVFIDPADQEVNVGIITPEGVERYAKGTYHIRCEFELDVSGEYQVFVENTSGITVQVDGFYTSNW